MFEKFKKVNEENSTPKIKCVAKNKCHFRFTSMCNDCTNNIGSKFKEKENIIFKKLFNFIWYDLLPIIFIIIVFSIFLYFTYIKII